MADRGKQNPNLDEEIDRAAADERIRGVGDENDEDFEDTEDELDDQDEDEEGTI